MSDFPLISYNRSDVLSDALLLSAVQGKNLEIAYALIGSGAKSQARHLESLTIQALRRGTFPLTSDNDAKHKSFGGRLPKQKETRANIIKSGTDGNLT